MANDDQMHAEGHEESTDQNRTEQNLTIHGPILTDRLHRCWRRNKLATTLRYW